MNDTTLEISQTQFLILLFVTCSNLRKLFNLYVDVREEPRVRMEIKEVKE